MSHFNLETISTYFVKFILFVGLYFSATYQSMIVIGVFVVLDLATAIWRCKFQGVPIRSKQLRNTIGKSTAYMIAVMVAHLFELNFLPIVPVMKMISFFIASAELKSIFENLTIITGLNFWDFIKDKLAGTYSNKTEDKFTTPTEDETNP